MEGSGVGWGFLGFLLSHHLQKTTYQKVFKGFLFAWSSKMAKSEEQYFREPIEELGREARTFLDNMAKNTGAGYEMAYEALKRCPGLVTCLSSKQAEEAAIEFSANGFSRTPRDIRKAEISLRELFEELEVAA